MNVNTIITAQSFVNYTQAQTKCDNTAWAYKFNNSWNECWYWGGFNSVGNIAKNYVFDTNYLPAGTKLSFPIPVKTYQPQLFSSYVINTTIRPVNNTQGYIVGQRFIIGNSLTNTVLTFTADSNVKLPINYAVSFYGQTWIGNEGRVIFKLIPFISAQRYISQTYKAIIKFYTSQATVNRSILPTIKAVVKGNSTMFANRYIVCTCKMINKGSVYIQPNCSVSWWIRKMYTWEDCQTWS
jgi:hypothetical protein